VRDDFTRQTVTEIAKGVGYRCSNPECRRPTVGANAKRDGTIIIGVAAHICAASPGGPRYDAAQTREARRGKDNGLWLCQNCGRLVDADPDKFTVEKLTQWKRDAQTRAFRELVAPNPHAEELARIEATIAADEPLEDAAFDALFQKLHAAAAADIATHKRGPLWSGGTVELTLRLDGDNKAPSFSISRLPLAVEIAPEVTIVAPPGTGKTTTLLQLAGHVLNSESIVPLYFRLGDWSTGSTELLASLARRSALKAISADEISAVAERGRLLLLLDGWNELTPGAHKRLRVEIGQIRRDWPDTRILVTTRRQALDVPILGPRIHIEPLSEDQQIEIAGALYGEMGEKIVDDAWRTPGMRALIATPLYLSALLTSGARGVSADTKEALLRFFLEQHERAVDHADALWLELLGCHAEILSDLATQLNEAGSTTMAEGRARQILAGTTSRLREQGQISAPLEPIKALETLTDHHALMRSGDGVSFQHQQFQEWYASHTAAKLMTASASGDHSAELRLRAVILDRPFWEESILFATERLSREESGVQIVARTIGLALPIDPMLAAEMIYRAAPKVWGIIRTDIMGFVARWHQPGIVDRAVRFMIITGRPDFASLIWPLASDSAELNLIPTLRMAPRFRPRVLGDDVDTKIAKLSADMREHLLGLMASDGGVDGMDLAIKLAKTDPSPEVQARVVENLQFRRADRHVVELLSEALEQTWTLVAARGYAQEMRDPAIASKLQALQQKASEQATDPVQRLHYLLYQSPDYSGRDTAIASAIADPHFPIRGQHGNIFYLAQQRAADAVLSGLRQRLDAGLELPYYARDLLVNLEAIDEGPAIDALLDISCEDRGINSISVVAGTRTVNTLLDRFLKCATALRAARGDRALSVEYQSIKDRLRGTRPSIFAPAIAGRANSDDPIVISSLASLISLHGEEEDRKHSLAIDPATRPQWISFLRRWAEAVVGAPTGGRSDLNNVSNAIGRMGFRELAPELRLLLDQEILRMEIARDGFVRARTRGDIEATSDARMRYDNQYCAALIKVGGPEVATTATQYLGNHYFGRSAALVLKSISDEELGVPPPDPFRRWPWFGDVEAARERRSVSPKVGPLNAYAIPIFETIDRIAKPESDKADQLLAIDLTRVALSLPHGEYDELIARVVDLPQPLAAKRGLFAALALDGQVIDADLVMRAIDEWLADASDPTTAWHKRQNTWEIEPWLELLPFSTRPDDVLIGLAKVKAFYQKGWAKRWERVLAAVVALPGAQGNALLERLARTHKDIADEHEWMRAMLNRGTVNSILLYVDLFIEGVLGSQRHGGDPWHAGRQLVAFAGKLPELKPELVKRYEKVDDGPGRKLLDYFFSEAANQDDLISMVKKYAANCQTYDGQMDRAIRAVTIDEIPVAEGSNVYNIYPASVTQLRKSLFQSLREPLPESTLAKHCLMAIDVLRDEYGIAPDDTRHPDVMSGRPWPTEAGTS
jgi:hypothetical protein